jgi:hypothetical protein
MWAKYLVTSSRQHGDRPARLARAIMSVPALAIALLAAACGFKSPSNGGPDADIDAPTNGSADASIDSSIDVPPTAWLHPWKHRKQITLQGSLIKAPGNGALTDFPVLVSVTDAQLAASALAAGEDIVFTKDDATTLLASEIESFTPATGQLVAWVKVPSLPATTDTRLYVYYGNSTPPARTPEDVWTASYAGVWHLDQDPGSSTSGNFLDATAANRDGTARNMMSNDSVSAQIGLGLNFDGMNDYLELPSINVTGGFTISMWIDFGGGNNVRTLLANSGFGGDTTGFRFFINTANTSDRRLIFETGNGTINSARVTRTNMNAIPSNAQTHVAVVVNRGAQTAALYVNGVSAAVDTAVASNFENNSVVNAARMTDGTLNLAGTLDELEIATTQRPAEWLLTSFNNQSQPSSFHIFGAEQQEP